MKERIREIAGGKIRIDVPVPALDPERIDLPVQAGVGFGAELMVLSRSRTPVRGFVYSDNRLVTPVNGTFSGGRCRIGYRVKTDGLNPGDEISGQFTLVTSAGEMTVPYRFTVHAGAGDVNAPETVDGLMRLYREDQAAAAEAFASPRFRESSFMEDPHCLALCETLLRGRDRGLAVGEFLRGMGYMIPGVRKVPGVREEAEERDVPVYDPLKDVQGYEAYRTFLSLVLEYRTGKFRASRMLPEMEQEAIRLAKADPDASLPVLFRAWLAVQGGFFTAAEKMLESIYHVVIDRRRTEVFEYCFYLYLRTCGKIADDQRANIIRLLERYYSDLGQPMELVLFVLYADTERYGEGPSALTLLRACYERGLRNPFLFQEGMRRFAAEPDLLDRLDGFGWECLRFSLYYGEDAEGSGRDDVKDALVTKEVAARAALLAGAERVYDRTHVDVMRLLYRRYPTDDLLRAVLAFMMTGRERGPKAFPWYEEGVKRSLDMMGLYEAFLASCPEDGNVVFPREMLLYYGYRNELPDDLRGVLYANILKTTGAEGETYELYRDQMEEFAVAQLLKGRMSPYLAPIYEHIVCREMIDARLARVLPDLLMARQVVCPQEGMTQVFVRYPELQQELAYQTEGHRSVCCPVYTPDALLLFGDAEGGRHVFPETEVRPLMNREELLASCRELAGDTVMLRLLSLREILEKGEADANDWLLLASASQDPVFHPEFRKKIARYLMDHWNVFGQVPQATAYLEGLDDEEMPADMRALYLELLVGCRSYDRAMQSAAAHGFGGAAEDALLSLVTERMHRGMPARSDDMTQLCVSLLSEGMDNAEVCAYLCRYYNGGTEIMTKLLRRSLLWQAPMGDLPERLLAQMLFTGRTADCDEVFEVYAVQEKVYHTLVQAYFVWRCHEHLVSGSDVPEWFFRDLREYRPHGEFPGEGAVITSLALLEDDLAAGIPGLDTEMTELADALSADGRFFACFDRLPADAVLPERLNGCRIIEFRTETPGNYWINCRHAGESTGAMLRLSRMCEGIYTCPVTLFSDEKAEVSVLAEDRVGLTPAEGKMTMSESSIENLPGTLFGVLNEAGERLSSGGKKNTEAAEDVLRRAAFCEEMLSLWYTKKAEKKGEPR